MKRQRTPSDRPETDPSARAYVAYFSMELGLQSKMPTYAGGLGILAGDTIRAAADLNLPVVAVSLVHRQGYFSQQLDAEGWQTETPEPWTPENLEEVPVRWSIELESQTVHLRAFRHVVEGIAGHRIDVFLLDTRLPENTERHRSLTDSLYAGDKRYRLCQEAVLGIGGVHMLEALGYTDIGSYHMNEGHSALLTLALLERAGNASDATETVRERCVFTTHTPVAAGHDQFANALVSEVLGPERARRLAATGCCLNDVLNMTHLALAHSRYVNGVAMRHGQISRGMFPGYPVASITNGVHAATWTRPPFAALFDRHIPDWRSQNENLRYAVGIPLSEVAAAHRECKADLLREVQSRCGISLPESHLTLGFARRATPYKRAALLLSDIERLRSIARTHPIQIIYAGMAHPQDHAGKLIIKKIFAHMKTLDGEVPIVYLENYDIEIAQYMCAGVDLWVNTPKKPEEASGTSGMKAALNGVPSLSVLDGWWIEGHVEGVTGWSIGDSWELEPESTSEGELLYRKLEQIGPLFFGRPEAYAKVMRHAIALNGSFFNAQRMIEQYAESAYRMTSSA